MITILILGLVLRLININQSLWLDEAVSVLLSRDLSLVQLIKHFQSADFHPPFHYFFLHFWGRILGWSEISMRLPSVFLGTATIWVVYKIAKIFTLGKLPILASLFIATAPFHIYYSQEARPYSLATFFAALSMYYFFKLSGPKEKQRKSRFAVHYPLFTILLIYTDYFGFLILFSQMVVILIRKKYFLLFYCFVVLLFFVPWLPMLLSQLRHGFEATRSLPKWGSLVNLGFLKALPLTFVKFSIGRITIFNKKLYGPVVGILFLIYGGITGSVFFQKKKFVIHNSLFIILAWLFIPLFSAWLISFFVPNYQPFRLLLVLPAFYLLLVYGIARIRPKMIQIILIIFILGVNLISISVYYFNSYFHREDWRGVVQFIEEQEKAVVILPSATSNWPWRYYSSGKTKLVSVSSGIKRVSKEDFTYPIIQLSNHPVVYYIRYLVPLFDPQERIQSWLKNEGFVKIKEISFNQIPIWEYK